MPPTPPGLPDPPATHAPSGLPGGMDELSRQIAEVEQRLMAREAGLQRRLGDLRQGARGMLRPRRSMVPWASVFWLGWSLLPRSWRPRRLSPATTISVVSAGLPLLKQVLSRRAPQPATMGRVDLSRYLGQWHEVARLPNTFEAPCAGQPTALYGPASVQEGVPWIEVVNRCPSRSGRVRQVRGVARMVRGSGGARLKVSFLPSALRWWPGAWSDYWILYVDEDYTEALVGEPGRQCLWVLSRTASMEPARLQGLLERARAQGFDVARIVRSAPP